MSPHGGVSITFNYYFANNIPEGSLIEAELVLENCQVASYDKNS
jgi:hypothetical protein